ncbi:MAG TPA: UDP-N-acetylmuramoyl-tripeptide--D-alanyl-D-alanine ligase [Candidatus Omnitrophota bacterium]|nr:UDP-N-acetylmuramoyl-tripeptide--D-alanyl-D-alanine ligase [Candidatus Omnitrophota bacterium]
MMPIAPFSIDTRTIQPGDIFVALDGTKQKGYAFLAEAFQKGAALALCASHYRDEVAEALRSRVRFVGDPALEMANWASEHRSQFNKPVIGVVGSVGKTSTKQFLAYLLSKKKKVLATTGNLNNQLGLPLMLSRLNQSHDLAVLEMGADHVGDLARLVRIAEPDKALLTPVAAEHLLGFGSLSGVYDGELEILQSPRLNTLVTVSGDPELDRRLSSSGWRGKIIRVGFSEAADIVLSGLRTENGKTFFEIQKQSVVLPTEASFLALNAGLAAAMAVEAGMSWAEIGGEWQPEMPKGRFAIRKIARDITVIDDTYNSSPKAFSAALEALSRMKFAGKRIVFSDMLELGSESARLHEALAEDIARAGVNAAWAFGPETRRTIEWLNRNSSAMDSRWFPDAESLARDLIQSVRSGDGILFKGSRGMRVEKVLEILEDKLV